MTATVLIYTRDHCPYCDRAKWLLDKKQIVYTEIDITHDTNKQTEMIEKSHRKTVPQLFINDTSIGGCDDLYALDAAGKLDLLLKG